MKTIGNIAAAILIFFGVLFIWGAFSEDGSPGWIVIGAISVGIGFVIIWFANRKAAEAGQQEVKLNIDISGDVELSKLQCEQCGGALSPEHVHMVAGAPTVECPYCGATYQLTEKPKW